MGTATFYQNTSDDRCLDKKLVQKATLSSFEYKDDTTVMNPVIIVDNNSNIMQSNYVYLSDSIDITSFVILQYHSIGSG